MKLPSFGSQRRYTAVLPLLDGGVDRHGGIAHPADNALWEGDNVWWRQGALRPRPGFFTTTKHRTLFQGVTVLQTLTDGNEQPVVLVHTEGQVRLYVFRPDGTRVTALTVTETESTAAFCVAAGGRWAQFYTLLVFVDGVVYGVDTADGDVTLLRGAFHEPLRLTDAVPTGRVAEEYRSGIAYEGANRLTPWFYSEFRPDGEGTHYRLPCGNLTGEVELTFSYGGNGYFLRVEEGADTAAAPDGVTVTVDRVRGWFRFTKDGVFLKLEAAPYNTVRVRACCAADPAEKEAVFTASAACWFGGKRSSAAGGTRLFLGNGSQLLWSAVEDPLYFPVENAAQVGMAAQTITALHRQADRLVIFKERELYSAEYEAVTNGTSLTETAAFPLTPLHGEVGCDLPSTIALRGNRLTWACRDGTVYTLSAFGSLTQPSVTRLSEAVEPLLRQTDTPTLASAAVGDGRYWLLWGGRLFVLEEGKHPVWNTFTVPDLGARLLGVLTAGYRLLFPSLRRQGERAWLYWFTPTGDEDCRIGEENGSPVITTHPIPVTLCTKAYDMGQGDTYKQVLAMAVEGQAASPVTVSYLTEAGTYTDRPLQVPSHGLCRLTPHLTRLRRVAVRLQGDNLQVDGITLYLRGGMR